MTKGLRRQLLLGLLLANAAFSALAQGPAPEGPRLPPAPTPTEAYPGGGMSTPYASPTGVTLHSWQSLYLPIRMQFYHGDINPKTGKPSETALSALVSIRNTDPRASLQVTSIRFYNAEGRLLRDFLAKPQSVPPLGTYELYLPRPEAPGRSGTNFIIEWSADRPINPPLVEAAHSDGRGLTFTTTAHPIYLR